MKTEKNIAKAITDHNYFIRSVICKMINYFATALVSIICILIGVPNFSTPFGEVFTYIGGGMALIWVILFVCTICSTNKLHREITEYEDNLVGGHRGGF